MLKNVSKWCKNTIRKIQDFIERILAVLIGVIFACIVFWAVLLLLLGIVVILIPLVIFILSGAGLLYCLNRMGIINDEQLGKWVKK